MLIIKKDLNMKLKLSFKKRVKKIIEMILFLLKAAGWYITQKSHQEKSTAYIFGVSKWKQKYIIDFLPEYYVVFAPSMEWPLLLTPIIKRKKNTVFFVWGSKVEKRFLQYALMNNIPVFHIEDGFVRSTGLGAMKSPPYSLCFDRSGIYYDATRPSDLENILNDYDFSRNPELIEHSKKVMDLLKNLGISKYNHVNRKNIDDIYGPKTKKRILVIGQVEDDASILLGSNKKWSNNDLVRFARMENPDAEIFYKLHPDVLSGCRAQYSDPAEISHMAKIIEEPLSLVDSFQTIDHVYTITSLSGFEALIRGISVTTVGVPFYSGWGLTDDRQFVERRKRRLTIEELFAGAYILYPRYLDPITKEKLTIEETIIRIASNIQSKDIIL